MTESKGDRVTGWLGGKVGGSQLWRAGSWRLGTSDCWPAVAFVRMIEQLIRSSCRSPVFPPLHLSTFLLSSLLLFSCTASSPSSIADSPILPQSTRPVIKIGLIAPFEGLYRRAGYEGLAAARIAVADQAHLAGAAGVDLLVQALDDSALTERAERARAKLLMDPTVGVIIGPLAPWAVASGGVSRWAQLTTVATTQIEGFRQPSEAIDDPLFEIPWAAPSSWGRTSGDTSINAVDDIFLQHELMLAVGELLAAQGVEQLWVGGLTGAGVPSSTAISFAILGANEAVEDLSLASGDGVLWLGSPANGAMLVNRLRAAGYGGPVWFGPWGGDPVLMEHLDSTANVFWAIWQDSHYTEWAESHNLSSPYAYLVYHATARSIWHLLDYDVSGDADSDWQVVFYEFADDGLSHPLGLD